MYDQQFDSPDFDYGALMQFEPQSEPQATQSVPPKISHLERFWTVTGNWGEFSLYFGLGLTATLGVRAIPVLISAAVILFPAVGVGTALFALGAETGTQQKTAIILLAIATALLAGNWDAWLAWIAANAQLLILTGIAIVLVLGLVIAGITGRLAHE
jgi:hypothetical protein